MMHYFGDIFYLKQNVTLSDIWDCIRACFDDKKAGGHLSETPQKTFYVQNDDYILSYKTPADNRHWLEFRYISDGISVTIVFDENVSEERHGKVHYLLYEEKTSGGEIAFYEKFLDNLQKFIPNKYLRKMKSCRTADILCGDIWNNAVDLSNIISNSFVDFFQKYGIDIQNNKLLPNFRKRNLTKSVIFFEDKNGMFPFDISWITKLRKDFWFLDVDFYRSKTLSDDELLDLFAFIHGRDIKSEIKRISKHPNFNREKYRLFLSQLRNDLLQNIPSVIINNKSESISADNYDEFKKDLLQLIKINPADIESAIQSKLPDYYENANDDNDTVDEKVAIRLKVIGVDSIAAKCKELEVQNKEKDEQISYLEQQISQLKEKISRQPEAANIIT